MASVSGISLASEDFNDPVLLELMLNAVVLVPCGHSVDEKTAQALKSRALPCPLDRKFIEKFVPNITLRNIIQLGLTQSGAAPKDLNEEDKSQEKPSSADIQFTKGKQLYNRQKYQEAVTAFLAALILNPDHEKASVFLEAALEAQKSHTESEVDVTLMEPPQTIKSPQIIPQPSDGQALQKAEKPTQVLPDYVAVALNQAGKSKALLRAVEEQNMHAVTYLLSQDADVNVIDALSQRTPLSIACEKGNRALILLLINNGAKVDSEQARKALIKACERGDVDVVQLLVENKVPLVIRHSRNSKDCEPLYIVVKKGNINLLRFFASNGLDLGEECYSRYHSDGFEGSGTVESSYYTFGEHAMLLACEHAQTEIARFLCQKGVNLDKVVYSQKDYWKEPGKWVYDMGGYRESDKYCSKTTTRTLREEAKAKSDNKYILEFLETGK